MEVIGSWIQLEFAPRHGAQLHGSAWGRPSGQRCGLAPSHPDQEEALQGRSWSWWDFQSSAKSRGALASMQLITGRRRLQVVRRTRKAALPTQPLAGPVQGAATPGASAAALHEAVRSGSLPAVQAVLAAGGRAFIDTASSNGWTALQRAAHVGNVELVHELLRAGASTDVMGDGWSALHWAVDSGWSACAAALLAAGASPNAPVTSGAHASATPLHLAASHKSAACIKILLASGGNIKATDANGYTALAWAAQNGSVDCVQALLAAGCAVDAMSSCGFTACTIAAWKGQGECLEALVAAGCNVDAAGTRSGCWTPLHKASEQGQASSIAILLRAGADRWARTYPGLRLPHHLAAQEGKEACLEALLEGAEPDLVEACDELGHCALHMAAAGGHAGCAFSLLAHGASTEAKTMLQEMPLHFAARAGSIPVIHMLLAAGADREAVGITGSTPTMAAAAHRHAEAMLALGGNLNYMSDDTGAQHCLHLLAQYSGARLLHPNQLHTLLAAGADPVLASRVAGPTPLDLVLSGLLDVPVSMNAAQLVRILVEAGCPVDALGRNEDGTVKPSTATQWLSQLRMGEHQQQEQQSWPSHLTHAIMDASSNLLSAAAAERPEGRPSFLLDALATGNLRLVHMVLQHFPSAACGWQPGDPDPSPMQALLFHFARAVQRLKAPAQATWEASHARPVLHFWRLASVLLAAGCPPVAVASLTKRGGQKLKRRPEAGLVVPLPCWAREPIRCLVPLAASGSSWSPEADASYPPSFRQAAKTMLLINDCKGFGAPVAEAEPALQGGRHFTQGSSAAQQQGTQGIRLPTDVLIYILQLAARPLPVWVPHLRPFLMQHELH